MKVSLSWLNEYVPVKMDIHQLVEALTMAGLEVDSLTDRYEYLNPVVVGRISDVFNHPGADNLKICDVDVGKRVIRVVCGAPNAKKDMVTAVALPGTELPNDIIIEKSHVRGELSEGMLCSEGELALGPDFSGIMDMNSSLKPGTPIPEALNLWDMVMDIDLTPNRSDCLSITGIAREIAALQEAEVQYPTISFQESPQNDIFSKHQ